MDEALESKRAECHRLKICGGQDFFSDRQRRPSTVRRNYRIKVAGTQAYPTLSILSFFSGAGGRVGPEDIDNPPKPLCTDLIAHVARQILRGCHHFLQGNHITLYSGLILIIFFKEKCLLGNIPSRLHDESLIAQNKLIFLKEK